MAQPLIGLQLAAVVNAVRKAVLMMHFERIPAPAVPRSVSSRHIRWTPSFVPGAVNIARDTRPYTAETLNAVLGGTGEPSDLLTLALLVLEVNELGEITDLELEDLCSGRVEFSVRKLIKAFRDVRRERAERLGLEVMQIA